MALGLLDIQSAIHSIEISDGGNSITVDASALDIRALTNADVVTIENAQLVTLAGAVSGSEMQVDIVSGTITEITNVVSIDDNSGSITVDSADLVTLAGAVSGSEMQVDIVASLPAGSNTIGDVTVSGNVSTVRGGYSTWKVTKETVSNVAESELMSTPLSGRISVLLQNLSNNDVWIKEETGVSAANSALLPRKGYYEAEWDEDANIFAISTVGTTNDVRCIEYAA